MSGLLEHVVERALHQLPNGVAMRLDDHTTAHGRVIRELCLNDKLVVPLAKILSLRGNPVVAAHP